MIGAGFKRLTTMLKTTFATFIAFIMDPLYRIAPKCCFKLVVHAYGRAVSPRRAGAGARADAQSDRSGLGGVCA